MNPAPLLQRIADQMRDVEALIAGGETLLAERRTKVSAWSVGQQVDHVLKAANGILATAQAARPVERGALRLTGRIVLLTGFIPRGVGKAPERAHGVDRPAPELQAAVERCRERLADLRSRPETWQLHHPVYLHHIFGGMNPAQAVRLVAIHTHHHLKIVRDIRRAPAA